MTTTTIIWVSVVVAVALLVALAVGLVLLRRRRISLAERQEPESTQAPEAPPRYRAGGPISFSSGGDRAPPAAPPPAPPRQDTTGTTGTAGTAGTTLPPAERPPPRAPAPGEAAPAPDAGATEAATPQAPEVPTREVAAPPPEAPPEPAPEPPAEEAPAPPEAPPGAPPEPPAPRAPEVPSREVAAPPPEAPPEPPLPRAPEAPEKPPAPPAEAPPAPAEEIEPSSGRLERLRGRLSRSRSALGQGLLGLLGAGDLDEDSWTDVEDTLLLADLGASATTEIVERLRAELASRGVRTAEQAREALRDVLVEALRPELDRSVRALPHDADGAATPGVVLVAGVNGTGKTTTTGKLARVLVADGRRVLLGAADTFRAAAVDQLQTWGHRAGAEVVRGPEGADPASVAFDAVKRGTSTEVDAVLLDTAGRLHTKTGLMDELGKVKRVVSKQAAVDEVLLVLDATTGQNGLAQARVFAEVVDITGIVLTKLDGTAKGGIVFQVQRELGVPVKLVGLGEGVDDLAPFEPHAFVDALLS